MTRAGSPDFNSLFLQARYLSDTSKYADAAAMYERVLEMPGGSERQRLEAQYWLGESLRLMGQLPAAFVQFAEVYIAAKERAEFHWLAYRSFFEQIEMLRLMQIVRKENTPGALNKRLALVDEGLRWLSDVGREAWRHALLLHKTWVLMDMGKDQLALDLAEEAYRLRKLDSNGYTLMLYAVQVASCARSLGLYERATEVLDEMEGVEVDFPIDRGRFLEERSRLLRAQKPPRLIEALDVARALVRLTDDIQAPVDQLRHYVWLADCGVAAGSLEEASAALKLAYEVAVKCTTFSRSRLLQNARSYFRLIQTELDSVDRDSVTTELRLNLMGWLEGIDEVLSKQMESGDFEEPSRNAREN